MAVPHMRRRGGGAIVMIASIWGRESGGRMTYNAVKAAEISLAKSMAQQLARDNIRVNSVAPGRFCFRGIVAPPSAGRSGGDRRVRVDGSCRSDGLAAPKKSGRSSRSSPLRARAGSAGQVCPLTAASHAPRSDLRTALRRVGLSAPSWRPLVKCLGCSGRGRCGRGLAKPSGFSCSPASGSLTSV